MSHLSWKRDEKLSIEKLDETNRELLRTDEELIADGRIRDSKATQTIQKTAISLHSPSQLPNPRKSLLLYQPANRCGGYVAIGIGNLTYATHLTITVPGFRGSPQKRIVTLVQDTENILLESAQVSLKTPSEPVRSAGIAWIGYRTPNVRQLPTIHPAAQGARNLSAFLDIIAAAMPHLRHVTVVGHSYGGVVTALTANINSHIHRIVLAGAPGAPMFTTDETVETFIVSAPRDRVSSFQWFTPTNTPNTTFKLVNQTTETSSRGHLAYFKPGTDTLTAIATCAIGGNPAEMLAKPTPVILAKMIDFAHKITPTWQTTNTL